MLPGGIIKRARREFRRRERTPVVGVPDFQEKYSLTLPWQALLSERTVSQMEIYNRQYWRGTGISTAYHRRGSER